MNFKTKFTRNKGITLIALVVTIIVLLILAGISIAMLTGKNGILNRAGEAKEKTDVAQVDENEKLQGYEDTINQFVDGTSSGGGNLPATAKGQVADTAIKNPDSYGKNPNAQATADGAGKSFAKPEGATYVEGTVDTGVVVNIKGSEFVWVPVDDVVLDESRDDELPKSSDEGTSSGKTYTPMAVRVGSNYKGLLYNFLESNGYLIYTSNSDYQGGSSDISNPDYQGGSSDISNSDDPNCFREPDVVITYDGGSYDTVEGKITKTKLTNEYNAMIESVLKYKGFYVARYEVVSSMIWGSQYDAMMNWMAKTGIKVGTSNFSIYNDSEITGGKDTDIVNNVYDLYGCHLEWTLEARTISNRTLRGGFSDLGSAPESRSFRYPYDMVTNFSSRATLYIK